MTTTDLVVDLRALLAEFRSPENRGWLTSACADRLEAVLTKHVPQQIEPGPLGEAGARLRTIRERVKSIQVCVNRTRYTCSICDGQLVAVLQDLDALFAAPVVTQEGEEPCP